MLETFGLDNFSSKFILTLLAFLPILYWYLTKNYNYWTKQGVKGPKPQVLFGNLWERVINPFAVIDVINVKKYGKVFGVYLGTEPWLQVADQEIVKQVLVKDFNKFIDRRELKTYHEVVNQNLFNSRGEQWKRIRTIASSTFTSIKMKKLYVLVRKCLQGYLDHLEQIADNGQALEVKKMHENLTMDVIASCAFATETNAVKDPNNYFTRMGRRILDFKAFRVLPAFLLPRWFNSMIGLKTGFDPEANEWIISLARHIVGKRRTSGEKNNDFLQLLMDANADDKKTDENENAIDSHYIQQDENENKVFNTSIVNKKLTENEILGQAWVFLLAGFETTATTLGYMSYLLATHPDIQERLHNELKSAVDSNGEIDYDTLHNLPYLDACISETLRVFPPLTRLERECKADVVLGNNEIQVKKGQTVEVLVYAMHHNSDYFPEPEKYSPDRFLPENKHHIIPYTYMPFGNGPRNCIGMRFALMEIKLAMTHILTKYKFTKIDKTEKNITYMPLTPLLAPKTLTVGLEKR